MSTADLTDGAALEPSETESPEPDAATPRAGWRERVRRIPVEVPILVVLAAITRFAGIYNPRAIVFDEVYFREYAMHYKAHTFYFDVHPPLAKLLFAAWGAITGVDATVTDKDPAVVLRLLPAFAGTLLILVIYAFIRQLSGSRRIATLGAGLLLLDNAILGESRLILMDSMLLLFGIGAITVALVARTRTGRSYWLLLAAAAALAGMSTATKVTGLMSLGMIGLLWLVDLYRERSELRARWRRVLGQVAVLALVPFTVYFTVFAIHFALLTKSGGTYDAYMSPAYQATLTGNANYRADAGKSVFWKFKDLNATMQRAQISLDGGTHPYATKWTSWPLMKRGVYMYLGPQRDQKSASIYLLGNPIVWWGTLLGVAVIAGGWIARPKRFTRHKWALIYLAIGWLANWLPFAFIHRPMFLYHYLFALIFSVAFMVIGIGALTGWSEEDERKPFSFATRRAAVGYWGILGAALLGFLYFLPITYGIPLTEQGLNARMWLHSWR